MTTALRDRVIEMADDAEYDSVHRSTLALAVAAMVAEECRNKCIANDVAWNRMGGDGGASLECADAIDKLAKELR